MHVIVIDVEAIKLFIENLLPFLRPRNTACSPPALPRAQSVFRTALALESCSRSVVLKTQRAIESVLRSEGEREYIKFIQAIALKGMRDIANVDTQNSASDSEKKCRLLSGSWAMMRCAPRRSLSLSYFICIVYDIYILWCRRK
jgi:hypothetical protein